VPTYVDITPHVSLLGKVGQAGHSVSEAIAELVDNALDARLPRRPVNVEIELDVAGSSLVIKDDGVGMSSRELASALVLAESHKNGTSIGRFGLGLKTACTSLGSRFTITSAVQDASYASVAEYDAESFLAGGVWRLPIKRARKQWQYGTQVQIECERLYPALMGSLRRNLGWTFRHFLLDDLLRLSINGERVQQEEYDVDPDTVVVLEGEVARRKVRGWAGLLRQSSQRGWYGFALIRHRRVVRRHEKIGFQAHPQTARVVGELHLDGFDTNNLKTDFIRETDSWRELERWVSGAIEPTLAASRKLAHAGMLDLKIRTKIAEQRRRHLDDAEDLHLPGGAASRRQGASAPILVAVGPLHVEHVFEMGAPDAPYVAVEELARQGEANLLSVRTNLSHTAATQVADRSGWACHNIAETAAGRISRGVDRLALESVLLAKLLDDRELRRALQRAARALVDDEGE
jgi:hypothetical protein